MKPWPPTTATENIRSKAKDYNLELIWTLHAEERMEERELLIGDIIYLLQNGFVYDEPNASTKQDYYKYQMEGTSPNSGGRTLKIIVIPGSRACLKIVTVMWKDEK